MSEHSAVNDLTVTDGVAHVASPIDSLLDAGRVIDSPLGAWTHHERRVSRLREVLDHLWHFDGRMVLPRERTFPGGYVELILHLGPLFRDVLPTGAWEMKRVQYGCPCRLRVVRGIV